MTARACIVLGCLVLAVPSPARAGDSADDARRHIEAATTLHQSGQWSLALDELVAAYELDPKPELLYAIAQLHVKLDNCPVALTYYRRFLDTDPAPEKREVVTKAIEFCSEAAPEPSPEPPPEPPPVEPVVELPSPPPAPAERPWYRDRFGIGLVGGGLVLGVVSALKLSAAGSDFRAAEVAETYPEQETLLDSANRGRTIALIAGVTGVAAVGAGLFHHFALWESHEGRLSVEATASNGAVTWSGRF